MGPRKRKTWFLRFLEADVSEKKVSDFSECAKKFLKMPIFKLDIPCRAGSAKTLLNASAWLSSKWSPRASTSITSEIILSLGAHFHAWYDGLGAFWFVVYFFKNVSPKHVQKLIPNMPVLKLNFTFWSFFLEPSKSSFQSVSRQKHVSMVHLPVAKINYFPNTRTHERTLEFWTTVRT